MDPRHRPYSQEFNDTYPNKYNCDAIIIIPWPQLESYKYKMGKFGKSDNNNILKGKEKPT